MHLVQQLNTRNYLLKAKKVEIFVFCLKLRYFLVLTNLLLLKRIYLIIYHRQFDSLGPFLYFISQFRGEIFINRETPIYKFESNRLVYIIKLFKLFIKVKELKMRDLRKFFKNH